MIQFSLDKYSVSAYIGAAPIILDFLKSRANFIDDKDLQREGVEVYITVDSKDRSAIIAFRSEIGYHADRLSLHYEASTETLFIGAGAIIKTIALTDFRIVFEKHNCFEFSCWEKHGNYILQHEELSIGVFNLHGEQLWEMPVDPPFDIELTETTIAVKYDGVGNKRDLATGKKV